MRKKDAAANPPTGALRLVDRQFATDAPARCQSYGSLNRDSRDSSVIYHSGAFALALMRSRRSDRLAKSHDAISTRMATRLDRKGSEARGAASSRAPWTT